MRLEDTLRNEAGSRFLVADDLVLDRVDQRAWLASQRLDLGSKSLALLQELMQHPQILVSKDRLFETGWPGQAVSDAVLTTAIRELRRALDDPARSPRWIETQHGKGYRFLPAVETRDVHPGRKKDPLAKISRRPVARPLLLLGALLLGAGAIYWVATGADEKASAEAAPGALPATTARIAVIPFAVEGGEDWIGSAISSRIDSVLQNSPGLFVVDRGLADQLATSDNWQEIAAAEDVANVIEGRVWEKDGKVHVQVMVRDAAGKSVWQQSFVEPRADLIELTERVAFQTARALRTAGDPRKLAEMAQVGTSSIPAFEAYAVYSGIMDSLAGFEPESRNFALSKLREAVKLDPGFATAAGELAWFTWPSPFSDDAQAEEARAITLQRMAIEHAANDLHRRDAQMQLDLRMLRLGTAKRDARALYEETRATSSNINRSILNVLLAVADATRDRELGRWARQEYIDYHLARGQAPMRHPHILVSDPDLLRRFAEMHAAQEPSERGDYMRHYALLLLGDTDDAARIAAKASRDEDNYFAIQMRLAQACAEGRPAQAKALAERVLAAEYFTPFSNWEIAELAGLTDRREQVRPKASSDAQQRALLWIAGRPGFDPQAYPVFAKALADGGWSTSPVPRPDFYCPLDRAG